jgi:hypothetical protein
MWPLRSRSSHATPLDSNQCDALRTARQTENEKHGIRPPYSNDATACTSRALAFVLNKPRESRQSQRSVHRYQSAASGGCASTLPSDVAPIAYSRHPPNDVNNADEQQRDDNNNNNNNTKRDSTGGWTGGGEQEAKGRQQTTTRNDGIERVQAGGRRRRRRRAAAVAATDAAAPARSRPALRSTHRHVIAVNVCYVSRGSRRTNVHTPGGGAPSSSASVAVRIEIRSVLIRHEEITIRLVVYVEQVALIATRISTNVKINE